MEAAHPLRDALTKGSMEIQTAISKNKMLKMIV